jgi:hypothetical protein
MKKYQARETLCLPPPQVPSENSNSVTTLSGNYLINPTPRLSPPLTLSVCDYHSLPPPSGMESL